MHISSPHTHPQQLLEGRAQHTPSACLAAAAGTPASAAAAAHQPLAALPALAAAAAGLAVQLLQGLAALPLFC
jgi:hypothetical protein